MDRYEHGIKKLGRKDILALSAKFTSIMDVIKIRFNKDDTEEQEKNDDYIEF